MIARAELHDAAQKAFPKDVLKAPREAGWQLVSELGWLLLPLSEDAGGLGLGNDALAAVLYESGRALASPPLLSGLLAMQALDAAEALSERLSWVERAGAGAFIAVGLAPDLVDIEVERGADGQRTLQGTIGAVADADMADHLLLFADRLAALVPLQAAGVELVARPLWDESRTLFDVRLHGHALDAGLVLAEGDEAAALGRQWQTGLLLGLAADSLGGARGILEQTIDYLVVRRQFDRPLAMFQALKHRCADLATRLGAAEALLWQRTADPQVSLTAAGALKAHAAELYRFTCEEAIQLHGGIGVTMEHYCHLFMKRANLNVHLGGSSDGWREAAGREALAALDGTRGQPG